MSSQYLPSKPQRQNASKKHQQVFKALIKVIIMPKCEEILDYNDNFKELPIEIERKNDGHRFTETPTKLIARAEHERVKYGLSRTWLKQVFAKKVIQHYKVG